MSAYARKFSKTPEQATLWLLHQSEAELETAKQDYQAAMRELGTAMQEVCHRETRLQQAQSKSKGASMAKLVRAEKAASTLLSRARADERSASQATQRLLQLLHMRTDMHETVKRGCGLLWSETRLALPRDTWLRMLAVNTVHGWELDVVARLDLVSREMHSVCIELRAHLDRRGVLFTESGEQDVICLEKTSRTLCSVEVCELQRRPGTKQALRYAQPVGWQEPRGYMCTAFSVEVEGWEKGRRLAMFADMARVYSEDFEWDGRILRIRRMGGKLLGMKGVVCGEHRYYREMEVETPDFGIECDDAEITVAMVVQGMNRKRSFNVELQVRRVDGKLELVWVTYPTWRTSQMVVLVGVGVDSDRPMLRVVRVP